MLLGPAAAEGFDQADGGDLAFAGELGIAALGITMTHGSNEAALMEDAAVSAAEMLEAAGAKNIKINTEMQEPGMAILEAVG